MDPNLRQHISRAPSNNGLPSSSAPLQGVQQYGMPQYHTQLPPLQHHQMNGVPQQSYMSQGYRPDMSRQHQPPPTTTFTSAPHMAPQNAVHSLPPSSFLTQPNQHYSSPQQSLPASSGPQSFQHIAPAPSLERRLELQPMPPGSYGQDQKPATAWSSQTNSPTQSQYAPKEAPRTHVVGSQGRRGILPSAPGCAPAVATGAGGATKTNVAPVKNEDGKFPCQHCNKTYLHAKHLKRHLLRHTGDRPYMCVLCKDTFSRSDILKRHFQKCSIRRGNPQGVSHLSHPHAHLKRSQAAANKAAAAAAAASVSEASNSGMSTPTNGMHGVNGAGSGNGVNGIEQMPASQYGAPPITTGTSMAPTQARYGEAPPSIGFGMSGAPSDSYPPPAEQPSNGAWYGAGQKQNSYLYQSPSGSPGPYNTSMPPMAQQNKAPQVQDVKRTLPPGSNGHPQSNMDWSVFNAPGHDGYMTSFATSLGHGQEPIAAPAEPDKKYYPTGPTNGQQEGGMHGFYLAPTSLGGDGTLGSFELWNFDFSQQYSLQQKADRLVDFCFPPGVQALQHPEQPLDKRALQECLTPDNLTHFLELSSHFQGHWPFIHSPTFNFVEAYDGLILCVICLGAVYSDRVSADQTRNLIALTQAGFDRTSRVVSLLGSEQDANFDSQLLPSDVEELQALMGLTLLSIWHGNPAQRAQGRSNMTHLARMVRLVGLMSLASERDPTSYSVLHNSRPGESIDTSILSWHAWAEQEKRVRLMHILFLLDSVTVIYFNCKPQYNMQNLQIPLPADDAPWEARSAEEWEVAVGLRGPSQQIRVNRNGTRRLNQLALHTAMNTLHSSTTDLEPGSTNVFSKFILIHALVLQICQIQKQLSFAGTTAEIVSKSNNSNTALPHNPGNNSYDCNTHGSGGEPITSHGTPVESSTGGYAAQALLKSIFGALQRWKSLWDTDLATQYPTSMAESRQGFCRDGGYFYWLARALLKSTRPAEWQAPADFRLLQVMALLKKIRGWVQTDSAQRGEEMGAVAEIDMDYAATARNLTLDMRQLFRPIHRLSETFVPAARNGIS